MARPKIYFIDDTYFEKIDSPEKAYVLGFIFADGCVTKSAFSVTLHEKDIVILNYIKEQLKSEHPIKNFGKTYKRFQFSSKKIVMDLINQNIVINKTYNTKTLPYTGEYFSHFLRGFFDGDGSVWKDNRNDICVSFSSNFYILSELKLFIKEKLNINSTIRYRRKGNIYSCGLFFRGSLQISRLYEYMYDNDIFCLKRKQEKMVKAVEKAKEFFKTDYKHNGRWESIKILYNQKEKQKEIAVKLKMPYSSVKACIQKMRKEKILL